MSYNIQTTGSLKSCLTNATPVPTTFNYSITIDATARGNNTYIQNFGYSGHRILSVFVTTGIIRATHYDGVFHTHELLLSSVLDLDIENVKIDYVFNGTSLVFSINGINSTDKGITSIPSTAIIGMVLGARATTLNNGGDLIFKDFGFDGEDGFFTEGLPSTTTTGSLGTVLTLNSTGNIDDMWVFVPDEAAATYRMCMAMGMAIPFGAGK